MESTGRHHQRPAPQAVFLSLSGVCPAPTSQPLGRGESAPFLNAGAVGDRGALMSAETGGTKMSHGTFRAVFCSVSSSLPASSFLLQEGLGWDS